MSPARRPPDPPGRPDRAALDALRAQMDRAGRTPKGVGRPARRSKRTGPRGEAESEWDEPVDEGAHEWDEPEAEAPTPLDDEHGGEGRWWTAHPGKPIAVEDGIAAVTRRGPIGATWWSKRFLGSLEAVLVGGRMERGRSYARKGQVVSLDVAPGVVSAVVQGSREEPYRVRLAMPVVTDEEWGRVIAALGAQARYAARLLAGELPHEAEEVFEQAGAPLFPSPHARLVTECTCPDFENPCKHIAAVCYLVAEMFDRDPFRVLEWRGRDRRAVVEALRQLRTDDEPGLGVPAPVGSPADEGLPGGQSGRGLPESTALPAEGFWDAGPGLADVHVRPVAAPLPDAVLRQLPRDLLVAGGRDVADVLAAAYEAFTAAAARRGGG